jgi:hypothetical protein
MIVDTLEGSANQLFAKLSKHTTMTYVQKKLGDIEISPEEMVTRLQTFINPETHIESRPGSVMNRHIHGTGRHTPAGGILVFNALKSASNLLNRRREPLSEGLLRLGEELKKLTTEMEGDDDYRNACVQAWRENNRHWGE